MQSTSFNITDISGSTTLSNGVQMPYLGLGVFEAEDGEEVITAIHHAIDAGYRHIDTAALYRNEKGVGEGIRTSGVDRKNIFVTSKLWNDHHGYENALKAFDKSMKLLKMDYLDLYLIHWPVKGKINETWRALEHLYRQGVVKAIGVSNFLQHHLEDLLVASEIIPMVNQMEFHPRLVQQSLLDYCVAHQIQYEAWSPLMKGAIFSIPEIKQLAQKYDKTPAQIVLRWNLQKGVVTIPKSVRKERILENANLFDFNISADDMKALDGLDKNERTGPHPDSF